MIFSNLKKRSLAFLIASVMVFTLISQVAVMAEEAVDNYNSIYDEVVLDYQPDADPLPDPDYLYDGREDYPVYDETTTMPPPEPGEPEAEAPVPDDVIVPETENELLLPQADVYLPIRSAPTYFNIPVVHSIEITAIPAGNRPLNSNTTFIAELYDANGDWINPWDLMSNPMAAFEWSFSGYNEDYDWWHESGSSAQLRIGRYSNPRTISVTVEFDGRFRDTTTVMVDVAQTAVLTTMELSVWPINVAPGTSHIIVVDSRDQGGGVFNLHSPNINWTIQSVPNANDTINLDRPFSPRLVIAPGGPPRVITITARYGTVVSGPFTVNVDPALMGISAGLQVGTLRARADDRVTFQLTGINIPDGSHFVLLFFPEGITPVGEHWVYQWQGHSAGYITFTNNMYTLTLSGSGTTRTGEHYVHVNLNIGYEWIFTSFPLNIEPSISSVFVSPERSGVILPGESFRIWAWVHDEFYFRILEESVDWDFETVCVNTRNIIPNVDGDKLDVYDGNSAFFIAGPATPARHIYILVSSASEPNVTYRVRTFQINPDAPSVRVGTVGTLTAGTAGTANFPIITRNIAAGVHEAHIGLPQGVTIGGWVRMDEWGAPSEHGGNWYSGEITVAHDGTSSLTLRGDATTVADTWHGWFGVFLDRDAWIIEGDIFTLNIVAPDRTDPDPRPPIQIFPPVINVTQPSPPSRTATHRTRTSTARTGERVAARAPAQQQQQDQPAVPAAPDFTVTIPAAEQSVTITIPAAGVPDGTFAVSIQGLPAGISAPEFVDVVNGEFNIELLLTHLLQAGVYELIFTLYDENGNVIFTSGIFIFAVEAPPTAPPAQEPAPPVQPQPTPQPTTIRLAIGETGFTLNGLPAQADAAPFVDPVYNRTMVPLRLIAEALGAQVNWNAETRVITINSGGRLLTLTLDESLPDGMGVPLIVNDRTFVPTAYVAQMLGANVRWDGEARAVYIQQ